MYLDNFNYSILGTNTEQRIVFLHGLMAFSANWRKIATKLEGTYQCLIYDQRGHGRSFKPESGYELNDFAEDLYKMTTELGWTSFHLVGHSLGARIAMVFADKYPEKVKTLIIEDMGASILPDSYQYYEKMLNIVPTPFSSREAVKGFFENSFLEQFKPNENPKVLLTFLQANIEEKQPGNYDWRFSKQAIIETARENHNQDRWREVSSFRMPVLLIRGEYSHILGAEEFKKMVQVNPQITGIEIKGAGHWLHYEKYEEFTQILVKFLSEN